MTKDSNAVKQSSSKSTVQPAKRNHLEEIPKVVALHRWLLFTGSVMIIMGKSNL